MNRVKSKVCIITGAASGIGRATVQRLAEEGASVALFDVLDDEGKQLADQLGSNALTKPHRYWHVDVTDEKAVKAAVNGVVAYFGALHVLVNNTGMVGVNKPCHEVTEAEWDAVQTTNVKGQFFCTKHAIPHLRRTGGGSVVNLSSIHGLVAAPDVPAYHASRGALTMMTKTDAMTYAQDRIRFNSIQAGFIWTPMVERHLRSAGATDLQAARREAALLHPLGHMGEPDDIAWGVVYLASDESRFMTGSQLVIDGGYTAH